IKPNDRQRIQRALEVCYLSGRSLTELQAAAAVEPQEYRYLKLALSPAERSTLHESIAVRFQSMMQRGFLDEVRSLRARGDLNAGMPSMRAVGYRQLWEYLEGGASLEEAVRRGIVATRRYAKRQLTWLRAETDVRWFESGNATVRNDALAYARAAFVASSG